MNIFTQKSPLVYKLYTINSLLNPLGTENTAIRMLELVMFVEALVPQVAPFTNMV